MIQIRNGETLILRTTNESLAQVVHLHIATIRRFQQGYGFPVTFVGYGENVEGNPAGAHQLLVSPNHAVDFRLRHRRRAD
jgi:hypothetical protein